MSGRAETVDEGGGAVGAVDAETRGLEGVRVPTRARPELEHVRPGGDQGQQVVDEARAVVVGALGVAVGSAFVGEQGALGCEPADHHELVPAVREFVARGVGQGEAGALVGPSGAVVVGHHGELEASGTVLGHRSGDGVDERAGDALAAGLRGDPHRDEFGDRRVLCGRDAGRHADGAAGRGFGRALGRLLG